MFQYKKLFMYILITLSFSCIAAGNIEAKEYAFFADSYEKAKEVAAEQGGELVSFCQGIGVLKKRRPEMVKVTSNGQSVVLYPDEVFTVEDAEIKESQQEQWHLDVLEAEEVWETATGQGVTIAVIDSGIDSEHEDLKEGIVYKGTTIPESEYGDGKRFDGSFIGTQDYFGHGTHVAGIIGARNNGIGCIGIAPDCKLISIKALEKQGGTGKGKTSWVASAIRLAIEQGADIINLSLGGSSVKNELLYTVIKEAWDKNILVVCAAGNISGEPKVFYPGAYEETVAVSAVKSSGDYVTFDSSYSNYGDWIDVCAPGSSIMSTIPEGYGTKRGTSMACPMVAGGAALLLEKKKDLSVEQICDLLYSSATDLGETGKDDKYGYGMINLKQMLQNLENKYIVSLPVPVFENQSKIRRGTVIHINVPEKAEKVVYTTDGTIPNADSTAYSAEGILISEELDFVTINCRCVTRDGILGENISFTYTFVDCESVLEKEGELEEFFPDYGNYIDEKSGHPYKKYILTLKPGEKLEFQLEKNNFQGALYLYDSQEMKKPLEEGEVQENGSSLLKWKNSKNQSQEIYVIVMAKDMPADLGEISYYITWNTEKTKNKENRKKEMTEFEDVKDAEEAEKIEEEDITWIEDAEKTQKSLGKDSKIQEKPETQMEIKEETKIISERGSGESETEENAIIYEEDWLYTMDTDKSLSAEDKTGKESESVSEYKIQEENTVSANQEGSGGNKERNEWQKTKNYLFIIVGLGIFLESLVIIWHIYGKKKDKRQESKKQL